MTLTRDNTANFNRTKAIGDRGEEAFINYLNRLGRKVEEVATGYFPCYDVRFIDKDGNSKTAEIKTCTSKYSNVAVEIFSRNKVAGVCGTKADYFIVFNVKDNAFYIADTSKLRQWIATNPCQVTYKTNKQNDSGTYLCLIPKHVFTQHFSKVSA